MIARVKLIPGLAAFWAAVYALLLLAPCAAAAAVQDDLVIESRPVSAGLVMEKHMLTLNGGRVLVFVLKADLSNPYLKINTLVGSDGTLNKNARVTDMAVNAGAVAAVNADFFQMMESGRPIGMTYKDGQLVTSPPLRDDMYGWAVTRNGVPLIDVFNFSGKVTAKNGKTFPLSGINKPSYFQSGEKNSHDNSILLYSRSWGQASRGRIDGNDQVAEVFVNSGKVTGILVNQPGQPIPENGLVLAGRGSGAEYIKSNVRVGDKITVDYTVQPDGNNIWAGTGGWSLLVRDGRAMDNFPLDINGLNARTAIGHSRDRKALYLVTVERSSGSRGVTLNELAEYMVRLGVDRALNFDGGGSTTMAVRPLGEDKPVLVNIPQRDVQRFVPTALGFFSTAPRGKLFGLAVKAPDMMFPGDSVTVVANGYDSYYNPFQVAQDKISWKVSSGPGAFDKSIYTARESGTVDILAGLGAVQATKSIRVLGSGDLKKIIVEPSAAVVKPGKTVEIKVSAVGLDGTVYTLNANNYSATVTPGLGQFDKGTFKASGTPAAGEIKVSFGKLSVVVPVSVKDVQPPSVFRDLAGQWAWAAGAVNRLSAAGIVSGYPGNTFGPDRQVTRAEFVVMLCKAMGWQPVQDGVPFKDSGAIPGWAGGYILAAAGKGVVSGYEDKTFRPSNQVTRAEMAAMTSRALSLPPAGDIDLTRVFADGGAIQPWAVVPVARAYTAGIMKGDAEKKFRPGDKATRAESAVLIDNAVNYLNKNR